MTWVIRAAPGAERLMEYESQLNRFTRDYDDSAMCLYYERSRFPPEAILGVVRTHPTVIYRGLVCENPCYVPVLGRGGGRGPWQSRVEEQNLLMRYNLSLRVPDS